MSRPVCRNAVVFGWQCEVCGGFDRACSVVLTPISEMRAAMGRICFCRFRDNFIFVPTLLKTFPILYNTWQYIYELK